MPPRSKIDALPTEVRERLEKKLLAEGFRDYAELSSWLQELGFEISKSAVHRWGQNFEDRVRSLKTITQQAKAVVEASPDEDGAVNDALIRLVQEKVFTLLIDFEIDPEKVDINKLTRAVADLARSSVSQKKLAAQIRKEATERAKERAAEEASRVVREMGLNEEQAGFIRAQILGVKVDTEDDQSS